MPNCQQIDPLVTPYVDLELADADRRIVEDHVRLCPPCYSRVSAEQAVHALLDARRPELRQTFAPPALRSACEAICHGVAGNATADIKAPRVRRSISHALSTNIFSIVAPGTNAPSTIAPTTAAPALW